MKEIDLLKERNDKIDWFSLRNQAAMVNAAAILGNNEMITRIGIRSENDREDIHTTIAKCAIEHADTLINELQKGQFQKQDSKQDWSEEDDRILTGILLVLKTYNRQTMSRIPSLVPEYISWLKSLKDRVLPQPQQKWSEEDRKLIDDTCKLINTLASGYGEKVTEPITFSGTQQIAKIKEGLHTLVDNRPQNHWKPSKEQMKVLNEVINFAADHGSMHWNDFIYHVLISIREQLKKLTE